jgi:sRNA-binding protein
MTRRPDPDVGALLDLLTETCAAAFSVYEKNRRPLKVGIHEEILAALDGAVTRTELARALRAYVSNPVYRSRLVPGAVRVGLDGASAGTVTAEQAKPSPQQQERRHAASPETNKHRSASLLDRRARGDTAAPRGRPAAALDKRPDPPRVELLQRQARVRSRHDLGRR